LRDIPHEVAFNPRVERSKVRKFYDALDETGREVCIAAFAAAEGNCAAAANLMGLHRNSVYRLVRRYGLNDHIRRMEK